MLRYNQLRRRTSHVRQGRFKALPIAQDEHVRAVLRYVKRNSLRAHLVTGAQDWPWSTLRWRCRLPGATFLEPSPVPLGEDWAAPVSRWQTQA